MARAKLMLADQEHQRTGLNDDSLHTPSVYLMLGLEIETLQ